MLPSTDSHSKLLIDKQKTNMDKEKYITPEMDFLEIAAERGFAESFGLYAPDFGDGGDF